MMLIGLLLIPLTTAGLIALTRQRALMELLHTLSGIATLGALERRSLSRCGAVTCSLPPAIYFVSTRCPR